ncbi:MAG: phosphotransferase [Gammaproteobacteria bacterium]|nr:phosphotransferase [Gammaproteobacteria bacterium]
MSHTMTIEQLGGLTNRNYKVNCERGSFVLRLAGEGTSDYIDRKAELFNASIASKAGVNAEIIHFDVDSGTMICRYIDNAKTMDIEGLRNVDALCRTAKAFRQLHDCGEDFQGRFELFGQIDQYLEVLRDLNADLPEGFSEVQQDAEAVRDALSRHELPSKPCHCDPMVENCVDNGRQMYIIDFEYAGNNDPMWDLGDISVEGDFTEEQDRVFLEAYFGHSPDAFDVARMVMYKAMCDLLWTLWGVVQHANNNPAEDFWAYAVERLERCKLLMASDNFPKHLEAVKRGPA